jgi:REP-associated tyrosine transposase
VARLFSANYAVGMEHKGWHSRGYLPHFDSQDVIQFVTYRLADSLPKEALERIRLAAQPESLRDEMLDRGWGACWLGRSEIAELVENSFLAFDGRRYRLHAWTIMPNHVHVLISGVAGQPLGSIVSSWKRFTARDANRQLGRTGPFWQDDYWDRFIRNEEHFFATIAYIDNNPVKAGLTAQASLWPWGSARFGL